VLAAVPSVARAECKVAYTSGELVKDLTSTQLALRALDESTFAQAGQRLEDGVVCVSNPVPTMVFASAYRYIGAHRYFENDVEGARRWFRSALELDPSYQWDASELELANPIRAVFEEERDNAHTPDVVATGGVLAKPAGSTYALDGRPLAVAAASPNRPHVLQQIATSDKSIRGTWLLDGGNFPAQVLQPAVIAQATPEDAAKAAKAARKEARTKKPVETERVASVEYSDNGAIVVDRVRPPEKTPLMILGAVAIAGAGGLYAASFITHDEFENAGTTDELLQTQTLTNALVVSSGGVLLAGLGIGYWGIVLDGGASVGVSGHF
jgi:hypothetical protein